MSDKLLKSVGVFGIMTFLSRIVGFLRDMVIAHFFGATGDTDAFLLAFKIPNLLRRLFAEGAFSQAFVPVLSEYTHKATENEVRLFIDRVFGNLGVLLVLVTVLGVLGAPWVIKVFAPGFSDQGERLALASGMLQITFPYLFFISLTAFMGAVLNTQGRFAAPSFAPVFLNLAMIFAAWYLSPYFEEPVVALAWGVLLGGVLQLFFQIPFLYTLNLLPKPKVSWQDPGVKRILWLMVPALFGVAIHQINTLVDTVFASFLEQGSISWLYYADRLMEFPLGIFGVGAATVILPSLSKKHAQENKDDFAQTLAWGVRWLVAIGLPSCVGLYCLAGPLLSTLFQSGIFSAYDVSMARVALMAYTPGVLALMLIKVLASGFYATQNIKTPVKIAAMAVLVNVIFNAILIGPLAHAGLALATSISAWVNAGVMFYFLMRSKLITVERIGKKYLLQVLVGSLVMAMVLQTIVPDVSHWYDWDRLYRVWQLIEMIGIGVLTYLACLFATGFKIFLKPKAVS